MTQRGSVPFSADPTQDPNLVSSGTGPVVDVPKAVTSPPEASPHEVERTIMHELQHHPSLKFTRLSVHQCSRDSICLEGALESNEENVNLCDVVRGIHDFKDIIDRVVPPRSSAKVPQRG